MSCPRICLKLAAVTMRIKLAAMTRAIALFLLAATLLAAAGCKTNKGSREFIPGRGWVPTR